MLKKWFAVILILILLLLFVGCSTSAPEQSPQEVLSDTSEPIPAGPKIINVGDTIITETREITIDHIEFSYDVLPNEKEMFFTHYPADSGSVYIDVAVSVKNTQKQQLRCEDVMTVKADYDNGFAYNAFEVVEDKTTGFTYANISQIDPLETVKMRYLVSCPQEVEENTEAPVYLILTIEGEQYRHDIR